ncbi:MAG: hypothetical protein K0R13_2669 [Propionibacteriaceae bacterium]|nr:hypothetical protein [Propionibacteriaceae bacterium]
MILKHATRVDLEVTRAAACESGGSNVQQRLRCRSRRVYRQWPAGRAGWQAGQADRMLRATTAAISTSSAARTR